jgi:hypothetical protein
MKSDRICWSNFAVAHLPSFALFDVTKVQRHPKRVKNRKALLLNKSIQQIKGKRIQKAKFCAYFSSL